MKENGANSYMKENSVHHSFYRGYTIHGTNSSLIEDNVAYDIIGHTFYLEDGVEENNLFQHNLAAHVHFLAQPSGEPVTGNQYIDDVTESDTLRNPADVSAAVYDYNNAHDNDNDNCNDNGSDHWFMYPQYHYHRRNGTLN
eukprot:Awhi_evm2s5001